MAAMAPALTEAATQAKIKLPESSSAASSDSVNGRDLRHSLGKSENSTTDKLTKVAKPLGGLATSVPVSHLNGDSLRSSQKPPSAFAKLGSIKVSANIKDLLASRTSAFQYECLKSLGPNGKRLQRMNQPSPLGQGNEEAEKCRNQPDQNGSHAQPREDDGRSVAGNHAKGRPANDRGSGQAVNLARSTRNMCRNAEEGDKDAPVVNKSGSGRTLSSGTLPVAPRVPLVASTTPAAASHSQQPGVESSVDTECSEVRQARAEAAKKQAQLERRMEFLLRRLRRVEGHQMESHVRLQLAHFIEYQRNNLQTVAKTINPSANSSDSSSDLKAELFSEEVKNLSTAALVSLVRRLQASQSAVHHQAAVKPEVTNVLTMGNDVRRESKATAEKLLMNLSFMQSALDSDATESSSGGESGEEEEFDVDHPPPATPLIRRAEWKWAMERSAVASRWTWLQAQVSDLEYRIRQQSDIYKQIRHTKGPVTLGEPPPPQDLMLRVTSHIIHRSIPDTRNATHPAAAGGMEVSPCNVSAVLSNVDKQASRLTQSLGNCLSPAATSPASSVGSQHPKSAVSSPVPAPNGLIESPLSTTSGELDPLPNSPHGQSRDSRPGAGVSPLGQSRDTRPSMEGMDLSPVLDATCRAARCLPLKHSLRKRKLLRTSGLHLLSRKAARLSTVKCHCHPPMMPCVVCGGRSNSVQTVDADTMPFQERVALLDTSFHQVLSFPEEVPLSSHFEALLKSGEWQNKPQIRRHRTDYKRPRCLPSVTDGRKNRGQFRKNAASVIISSAKIRSKYENKAGRKRGPQPGKRLGKRAMNAELKRRRGVPYMGLVLKQKLKGCNESYLGNFDTPAPSPLSRDSIAASCPNSGMKEKEVRKRRGESAYDINNIVIPYSMASVTRVEKLPYKEIVTPKWRDLTLEVTLVEPVEPIEPSSPAPVPETVPNGMESSSPKEFEEMEDLSDEAFAARHKLCEAEEKKRFSNFVQYPPTRRNRSRSEVSGQSLDSSAHDLAIPSTPDTPSHPVSMGTQASLDVPEFVGDDWQEDQTSRANTPLPSLLAQLRDEDSNSGLLGSWNAGSSLRRGSISALQRERLSLGSSMDEGEAEQGRGVWKGVEPWVPRSFPLTEEEVAQLDAEQSQEQEERRQPYSLRPAPATSLRVSSSGGVSVEAMSRAESSASGSQPGSPMASSTSMSAVGDADPADPEWLADGELAKKPCRLTKR